MSTKFFNNTGNNTLFNKLKGIAEEMRSLEQFLAVVGFFRSSGYFKLREKLENVPEIKILVGINVDKLFENHNPELIRITDPQEVKEMYIKDMKDDILTAEYSEEVEQGILQMYDDLTTGRLEIRIHPTKKLHAKFYLCLPKEYNENTDGWVIMGSSNISASGLGIGQSPQYELNVAMKDYDDVKYCSDEFWKLWEDGVPLDPGDGPDIHLGYQPTPYELYMKVLIDFFGDQVEDNFTIEPPEGYTNFRYQQDAVVQGYQMLKQHNGVILADVVGLGKTIVATMIAKRFIEENGRRTKILVVHPPALRDNWVTTFRDFDILKYSRLITNGSLSKVLEEQKEEEFNLIIVDEAHGFRNHAANRYDELQRICKSNCSNIGRLRSTKKKVMLLSATPLNNTPKDLLNLLLLFQDSANNTIEGISNLREFFARHIARYNTLMRERAIRDVTDETERIYQDIRTKVIDKVTIRRTRSNIEKEPTYNQEIRFPKLSDPIELRYKMDRETSALFYQTLLLLTDERTDDNPNGIGLNYARYRAIEFLKPEKRERYSNAEQTSRSLAGIYRVHMVKRLESSFCAFKRSLQTFLDITDGMIEMYKNDNVIIAPNLRIGDLQKKGLELDQIIETAVTRGYDIDEITYQRDDFEPQFIEMLEYDRELLRVLIQEWNGVTEDPKFALFQEKMEEIFNQETNPTGKLVLFSESVDTLEYLKNKLSEIGRNDDVLMVTAGNRRRQETDIKENFDANSQVQRNDYNIIITSDVLAEGVNLHRSNVIVNYDSPWNATRLMQRIGRVNRIGSTADNIYNYMFYPSQEGDEQLAIYRNALIKLQGFHSAFGEDAKIYSREEIVRELRMYNSDVQDSVDERLALLRKVKELYQNNRELYDRIKALQERSRVIRQIGRNENSSVVFVSSDMKTDFYLAKDNGVEGIDFLEAAKYLEAEPEEQAVEFFQCDQRGVHYTHVNEALRKFEREYREDADTNHAVAEDKRVNEACNFLRRITQGADDSQLVQQCEALTNLIRRGTHNNLVERVIKIIRTREMPSQDLHEKIYELYETYYIDDMEIEVSEQVKIEPKIIVSETFI